MSQAFKSETKFRPYFTREELSHIISLVQSAPDSEINRKVFSYLQTFAIKINHSIVKPAIQLEGTKLDKIINLIMPPEESSSTEHIVDKEIHKRSLFNSWNGDKLAIFTPVELNLIHQYRYESDLMTPEESQRYENELFKSSTSSTKIS